MKYKLVIFDFDGTLADSFPWFMTVANDLADQYKFKRISPEEQETLRGYGPEQLIRQLKVPVWKIPQLMNQARALAGENIDKIPRFEGVDRLLQQLVARGIVMGIVSSNSEENIRRVLGSESAARIRYFECGISLGGKPSKLRGVLKQSGIPLREAIYIGDEIRDLEAARDIKMAFGAVAWGYTRIDALAKYSPDEVFTTVDEIAAKLL